MRETELKAVVPDEATCTERLRDAGARLVYTGRIEDARFDTADLSLFARDLVLRIRSTRRPEGTLTSLDFKGPTTYDGGFKHRDETSVAVADRAATARILESLGFSVSQEIDRDVTVFALDGAVVRFERFPRMDVLVEVEGDRDAIERAIIALGIPRSEFTPERLSAYVARYEARTGQRAAICARETRGDYRLPRGT